MHLYFKTFNRLILKSFIFILLYIFQISNSFAAMVSYNQIVEVNPSSGGTISGVAFNNDGTKMFTSYFQKDGDDYYIREYNLSKPYDISTRVYAGDSERCLIDASGGDADVYTSGGMHDLEFSSDGMKLFFVIGNNSTNFFSGDNVYGYDLDAPYNLENCEKASHRTSFDAAALQQAASQAGNFPSGGQNKHHTIQGVEISDDGKKLFLIFFDNVSDGVGARLYEYDLSTPYDVSTLSIVSTAGIELPDTISGAHSPSGIKFSSDGKRIFIISHVTSAAISQISLDNAFDTSSYTFDGGLNLESGISPANNQPRGISFSASGLKLYIGNDKNENDDDQITQYDLACPFNIIEGSCPAIANKDRIGIAEAQIMVAKRTIEHSTDSVLNRLQWIRRNKDNQNLTNLNIDYNLNIPQLDNQLLKPFVKKIPEKITVHQASIQKKINDKNQDVFYWSEGSISFGRVGDTNISSSKIIETDAITFGSDKFKDNKGIYGTAFRFGKNNVDVGNLGSNLDTDTYNLTFYSTSPIEGDTNFLDTVFGIGNLRSNILSVVDGENLAADRDGHQIYGTIKIKDEIKKNNFTLIPSGRFDIGHSILDPYEESGSGAIKVKKQIVRTKNLSLGLAVEEDLSNGKYYFKRHGKLEYVADIDRSSNFKYHYVSDNSVTFNEKLHSGSLHNLTGEFGIDIVSPNGFSIFMIYERNQALRNSHTDKIHLALGYLPNKKTNYAFKLAGTENLGSEYKISKNINDFEIDFNLNNKDVLKPNRVDQASISLIRKF